MVGVFLARLLSRFLPAYFYLSQDKSRILLRTLHGIVGVAFRVGRHHLTRQILTGLLCFFLFSFSLDCL